jgi:adenosylhomocysteine nucleosidase
MIRPMLMIFTAVALEAKAVAEALGMKCPRPGQGVSRDLGGHTVSIHLIGIGGKGVRDVPLQVEGVSCVVMAGLAGALDPSLRLGDVVIDEMPEGMGLNLRVRRGRIYTSERIVPTPGEKAELFARTGAMAVDMENSIVREWAGRHGVAFAAIRAISDRADQSLDPAVVRLVDQWGRVRPITLVRTLLGRPSLVPALLRLGADSKTAARQLGLAVKEFVKEYESARVVR